MDILLPLKSKKVIVNEPPRINDQSNPWYVSVKLLWLKVI
jgi:hypothetical protein